MADVQASVTELVPFAADEASPASEPDEPGSARELCAARRSRNLVAFVAALTLLCTVTRSAVPSVPAKADASLEVVRLHAGKTAKELLEEHAELISSLDMTVLQCDDGVEKLNTVGAIGDNGAGPGVYIINAMLTAVGERADACSISGGNVHKDPPQSEQQICFVHCGEPECGAALDFVDTHQKEIAQYCAERVYLQGGAKCFVESGLPQKDSAGCAEIVGAKVPCDDC